MDQVTSQILVRESFTYLSCKSAKYVFLSFYPTVYSRIANLFAFCDLK